MRRIEGWLAALRDEAQLVGWRLGHLRARIVASREDARRRSLRDIVAEHQAMLTGHRARAAGRLS